MYGRKKDPELSPRFQPHSSAVLESPEQVRDALMGQTHGRSNVTLSENQALFLAHTHAEVQKRTNFAAPGSRPSEDVAKLRSELQRGMSASSDLHALHFEESFVATTIHTPEPLTSALPAPHFGQGTYAFDQGFASAVGSAMHPPVSGLPAVPAGRLSYTDHQLRTDRGLSSVVDHLSGRTTGQRPRQGTPRMAMGRFDTAVVQTRADGTSILQQVDDKFNSASNHQDGFSQDQAERYATIVRQGGGSSEARPNDLMQISQHYVTPAYRLEDLRGVPAMATRATSSTTMQARKFDATLSRDEVAYGSPPARRGPMPES